MTVKYQCPKCERKFVDWGAQKLDFTCPDCEEDLAVVGGTTGKTKSKPSLRRPVPTGESGPRRVTSFDTEDEEAVKPVVSSGGGDDFDSSDDSGSDFDDDESDIDLSGDDDDVVEVDDSDD